MTDIDTNSGTSRIRRLLQALDHAAIDVASSIESLADGLDDAAPSRREAQALASDVERMRELLANLTAEIAMSERTRAPVRTRRAGPPASVALRPEGHGP